MRFSVGNRKLGKDTLILNMTSATDCVSKRLGLCQLASCKKCYAYRAEVLFPNVLAFRRKQAQCWRQSKAKTIAMDILDTVRRKQSPIKFVRFSESGDFRSQADISKLAEIASMLPHLSFFGYTARKDLDFGGVPSNMAVNGSGFMIHNQFRAVNKFSGDYIQCYANCRECNICKGRRGVKIENLMH